ncbi:MAG: biotin/lipoyl-binding protein [Deltaproteobacteria bacterium]|nr:biotin/lipoyl-binding protein [Deltaproteobacteria bacterium]
MAVRKYDLVIEGRTYEVEVDRAGTRQATVKVDGVAFAVDIASNGAVGAVGAVIPSLGGGAAPPAPVQRAVAPAPAGAVVAPMPGLILSVLVTEGQKVEQGTVLAQLEAMKMENNIMAPSAGTVKRVLVSKGAEVASGQALFEIGAE